MAENGRLATVARGSGRGVVAAMAMTGFRTVSAGLGLMEQPPPEEVAERGLPHLFDRIPPEHRDEAIQLAHWAYGAAAGALYGALPSELRRLPATGAAYGLAIWVAFEAGVAPMLGLRIHERGLVERAMLAADHVLYGMIVGARPRPM